MERIRLGLAGLGAILMIVFVASAGMRADSPEPKSNTPGETLSVLGVAPNMDEKPENAVTTKPERDPAQPRPVE